VGARDGRFRRKAVSYSDLYILNMLEIKFMLLAQLLSNVCQLKLSITYSQKSQLFPVSHLKNAKV
jgi:hypothetical protein